MVNVKCDVFTFSLFSLLSQSYLHEVFDHDGYVKVSAKANDTGNIILYRKPFGQKKHHKVEDLPTRADISAGRLDYGLAQKQALNLYSKCGGWTSLLPAGRKFCKITQNRPNKRMICRENLAAVRPPIFLQKRPKTGRKNIV
jgi:hypothetical protein